MLIYDLPVSDRIILFHSCYKSATTAAALIISETEPLCSGLIHNTTYKVETLCKGH